jgi:hypothetical protein
MSFLRYNFVGAMAIGLLFAGVGDLGAATCVVMRTEGIQVCASLSWGDPKIGTDFSVDFNPLMASPDVRLHSGDLDWVLVATQLEDGSPADLGEISIEPRSPWENFGVSIGENYTPGAHHVGSMHLTARQWRGFSNLNQCLIAGDFAGGLTLRSNARGQGGELLGECSVLGQAQGVYWVPRMIGGQFSVGGLFDGQFLIGESMLDSSMFLSGDVSAASHIMLRSLEGTTAVQLSGENRSFAGALSLPDGLPDLVSLTIGGYAAGALIDFNHQPIGGFFSLDQGGYAHIVRGGQVLSTGHVWISNGETNTFTGYAEFLGVDLYGVIEAEYSNIDGVIVVQNDLNGTLMVRIGDAGPETQIIIGGDVGPGAGLVIAATPWFGGHFSGLISVEGSVHGWLGVARTLSGQIRVGDVTSGIEIGGSLTSEARIIVDGMLYGSIDVGGHTQSNSLIHVSEGGGVNGSILLNSQTSFEPSWGDIRVGTAPSNSVVFQGHLLANASYRGGAFMGNVIIEGCHPRSTQLNFCFEGGMNGTVDIVQRACRQKAAWTNTRCP